MAILILALLEEVNDFTYWLQDIDLARLRASKFDLCVIDYAHDGTEWTKEEIAGLRQDKVVLSYLSIGEAEDYRWYWQKGWKPEWLGPENPDWPGNYKVKYWHEDWQKIVFEYLDRILAQGFDGVYLDILDAYAFWKDEKRARALMIEFVQKIAKRGREKNAKFRIFVQNAEELLADDGYLKAIDGIGREEIWYVDNVKTADAAETELWLDRAAKAGKTVLAVEYVDNPKAIDAVYARAKAKGYLAYVTTPKLDELTINPGHEPD